MSKATALKYTAAEKRAVDAGWFALMRAVESSHDMEKRIQFALSERKRGGVAPVGARYFVIEAVRHGRRVPGPATLSNLSHESIEYLACYFVGVWLGDRTDSGAYSSEVWTALAGASAAHVAAHNRYLEST